MSASTTPGTKAATRAPKSAVRFIRKISQVIAREASYGGTQHRPADRVTPRTVVAAAAHALCREPRRASRFNDCGTKRRGHFSGRAARFRVTRARRCANSGSALDERVIDVLDVLVLLELVDHREGFGGLRLRQLDRCRADVLVRRGHRRDAALLERLLHVAEIGEQAARDDLRLALVANAVAHLLEAMVDQIQLEVVVIDA